MRYASSFALTWLAVAYGAPAAAQSIEEARRLYLDADFQEAIQEFEGVLASPGVDALEAEEAHRYLAMLRVLMRDEPAARRHADAAVALDPDVEAPEGAPPEVSALLDAAREASGRRRAAIAIAAEGTVTSGERTRITATLAPAPEALAAVLSLRCASGGASADERGAPPSVSVELAVEGESVVCRAAAGPASGASLITARAELAPAEPTRAGPSGALAPDRDEEEGGAGPWLWIGIGAGVVAVGTVVAILVTGGGGSEDASLGSPRVEGW